MGVLIGLLLVTSVVANVKSDDALSESLQKLLEHVKKGVTFKKCCLLNETYRIGFDTCQKLKSDEASLSNEVFTSVANKTQCPIGRVATTLKITKVNITKDGLFSNGGAFLAEDFCVDEFLYHVDDDVGYLIARFCTEDPCDQSSCIRKCCPTDMVLNQELGQCQERSVGTPLVLNETTANESNGLVVRGGVFPWCPHGAYVLDKDEFTIQANGEILSVEHFENDTNSSEYCVDNFVNYEGNLVS